MSNVRCRLFMERVFSLCAAPARSRARALWCGAASRGCASPAGRVTGFRGPRSECRSTLKSVWHVSLRRARLLCTLSASRFVGISPESLLYCRGSWGCSSSRLGLSLWVPHSGPRVALSRAFGHHAPNPSLKRTRHGQAFRAFISF